MNVNVDDPQARNCLNSLRPLDEPDTLFADFVTTHVRHEDIERDHVETPLSEFKAYKSVVTLSTLKCTGLR